MADFTTVYVLPFAWIMLGIVCLVAVLLGGMAYLTLWERKVLAGIQLRRGPNVVGPFGLLQPLADGLKLLTKETIIPSGANVGVFLAAPLIAFTLALLGWAVIPFQPGLVLANINVGVLFLLGISSLGVYGIIMAGWASNSKYAFLGAMRSAAQMVSYEVSMGFVIVTVLLCAGSLNLSVIVESQNGSGGFLDWYGFGWLFPMMIIFFVSSLAETNRLPFDLPEGESELVAGFFVEYSSMAFALFYLGEYMNMMLVSALTSILFLGGWLSPIPVSMPYVGWLLGPVFALVPGAIWFALKIAFVLFFFLVARGAFPRYRYDQLMRLGWKIFLPFSLCYVVLVAGYLVAFDKLPK